MNKIIIAFILLSQSLLAYASQPFSKELITSFYATVDKLDKLEVKYPEVFKNIDRFSISEQSKIINYIKSSNAYPDIASALSSNGFVSLNEFLDVSERFMGSLYSVQMQKMPKGAEYLKNMEKALEDNIKVMKKEGAPKDMIKDMEMELQMMKKETNEMQLASKNASKSDIKFVKDNFDWLISVMPEEKDTLME